MATKKNLVVIGFGGMGSWHVGHAGKTDCVNLLGIYDIKEERRAAAREAGIYAYESLEEVIADGRVDLCTVAIPNDAHHDTVIRLLEGGKNVICEKPVTLSSQLLSEMIAAAEQAAEKQLSVREVERMAKASSKIFKSSRPCCFFYTKLKFPIRYFKSGF